MKNKKVKKDLSNLSDEDKERLELLQKAHEKKGKQLRFDASKGDLTEIDELRQLIGRRAENPDEKYDVYYRGIRTLLMKYLPKGKEFKEGRQLIYDEKNVFLNTGKKKSDNKGIRKSDGRMAYQIKMNEILDLITKWISESQNPTDLYNMLYELNEKSAYGHEIYDGTSIKYQKAFKKEKGNKAL